MHIRKIVVTIVKKWNINARPRYIFSILVILVLDVLIASSIAWLLLNNKSCAYAAEIGYSDKVNEKPLNATTSVRSTNKVTPTTEITATSSSSSHSKSPLGAVTSSLPSIINEIKRGNKNNNVDNKNDNYLKAHSIPLPKNHILPQNSLRSKRTIPSTFEKGIHGGGINKKINIAFIKPSFTAAAYDKSFYVFYTLYKVYILQYSA